VLGIGKVVDLAAEKVTAPVPAPTCPFSHHTPSGRPCGSVPVPIALSASLPFLPHPYKRGVVQYNIVFEATFLDEFPLNLSPYSRRRLLT